MTRALIALHFQKDICHPDGLIPFAVDRSGPAPDLFLDRSRTLISRARQAGWLVVHVHIAFQPDYSDLLRHAKLFRAAAELGALKRGSWGAAPMQGFEPEPGDVTLMRACNNAIQIHGGYGYTREFDVERYLRDAKLGEIGEGTNEVQKMVIARELLKDWSERPGAAE